MKKKTDTMSDFPDELSTQNSCKVGQKGKILRVKHGYNPNSSSMGSVIVFALPVGLFGITVGFGLVSSLILSHFIKDNREVDESDVDDT